MIFSTKRLNHFFGQNVFVLSFTSFIITAAKFTWYPILPVYLVELGANDFQVAFTYTLLTFSSAFMQFLGGMLSDVFGRKHLIVIPTFLFPICYLFSANALHWITLTIFLIFADSLSALQLPSFNALIAESIPKDRRGQAYGFFNLFMALGNTLGPTIGMILIYRMDIKNIFYVVSFINFVCALGRAIWLQETHHIRQKADKLQSLNELKRKKILSVILALSPIFILKNLTIRGPFISLFAHEVIGLEKPKINLFFALGGLAAVAFSLIGGKIIDKLDSKRVLLYSVLGLGLFIFLWSLSTSFLLIVFLFSISYIFYQSCQIAYDSYVADITQKQSRGFFLGFIATCNGLIGSSGPYLGGYLKNQFGAQTPFLVAPLFAIIAFFLINRIKE